MRRCVVLLAAFTLVGSARTRLAPQAERVRVTLNQDAVTGCRLIGNVEASQRRILWIPGAASARESVHRKLRNDAAKMRADVVVIRGSMTSMRRSYSRGEAYACT